MKKLYIVLKLLILITSFNIVGQVLPANNLVVPQNIPQEKIYLHFNTNFLITGENLYYKIYCIDSDTKRLSNLSKVAYVELVSRDKKSVFKHKILLENGVGNGDFFIPTSIPSGNYKLIAYTQWMENFEDLFCQDDLSIINPFDESRQSNLKMEFAKTDSIIYNVRTNLTADSNQINGLKVELNGDSFSNREEIALDINTLIEDIAEGNYSISIRKKDNFETIGMPSIEEFYNHETEKNITKENGEFLMPELRGELLEGKILDIKNNRGMGKVKIGFSIPGRNYLFKITESDENGHFFLNINSRYNSETAFVDIIDANVNKPDILIHKPHEFNYNKLKFSDFKFSKKIKDTILYYSICNQIENAYMDIKQDTLLSAISKPTFDESYANVYDLDDYTRFPTLKETIVEILNEVTIKNKQGKRFLHVRIFDNLPDDTDFPSLVILDGVMIRNHEELIDFNAYNIKKISVFKNRYIYGSTKFEGIIVIETLNNDFNINTFENNTIKEISLFKPLTLKKYYHQSYAKDGYRKIPDFRRQLLWEPNFQFDGKKKKLSFFSSDVNGVFIITIEGFTGDGKPIYINKTFEVIKNKEQ